MPSIRIPTPLRAYTAGQPEVAVEGATVGAALNDLTVRHPALKQHLFAENGELRAFVNIFLNEEDVRGLQGANTPVQNSDRLMIIPSIAGGAQPGGPAKVDHSALRVNQAAIILLLLVAFVFNLAWLAALVAAVMLYGAAARRPGFRVLYDLLRRWIRPELLEDHPEPHLFAQGFGGVVLAGAAAALLAGLPLAGWALAWLVIGLAALNLLGGFCLGCAMYYWLGRLGLPGFTRPPLPGVLPGMRPRQN